MKNGQFTETGKIGYTRRRKSKQKNTTQYVLDTTMRKQIQITLKKTPSAYNQLEVMTNQAWCLCGNRKDISTQNSERKYC